MATRDDDMSALGAVTKPMVSYRGRPRIAVIVPGLALGGGVATVASFLYRVIAQSGYYDVDLISVATSSRDEASVRLISSRTWLKGPQVFSGLWNGLSYRYVGAVFTEFEFQRYRPRAILTQVLRHYDLIQIVAGTPPWALIARDCGKRCVSRWPASL